MSKRDYLLQNWKALLSAFFTVAVFLFWWRRHPEALSYQEQYQLFLFDGDYIADSLSFPGGAACYISEFIIQFYYIVSLGAFLLALLMTGIQRLTWRLIGIRRPIYYMLSFLPSLLILIYMGDINVMLSLTVAIILALSIALRMRGKSLWTDIALIPALYWLIGPIAMLYVVIRALQKGWRYIGAAVYLIAVEIACYAFLLPQYSLRQALLGIGYYRVTELWPTAGHNIYDTDTYALLRQDYMIRNERWGELIKEAERYTVHTPFWSVSVNLALSETGQLANRMFTFYQSGADALIMPMKRDMTSDMPSAEAFFRLGMIASAQRYAFDMQESIPGGKKSGRLTKRIAECMIIDGQYKTAAKQLKLLSRSLFYRRWAKDAERYLGNDKLIDAHPVWGRLRKMRYKDNFLYNYIEMDKMLGLLFLNNTNNKMALDYFIGQSLLNGNQEVFRGALAWAKRYGGYDVMPVGYSDALRFMMSGGRMENSSYGNYVRRMMKQ